MTSVSLDLADTGLTWSANPNRFHIGDSNGVVLGDIVRAVSADQKILSLAFAPASFRGGRSFRFGMSVFSPLEGSTQEDPDRLRGMKVTAKLDDGATFLSTVRAEPKLPENRFTGAGLVNAAVAVRAARRR